MNNIISILFWPVILAIFILPILLTKNSKELKVLELKDIFCKAGWCLICIITIGAIVGLVIHPGNFEKSGIETKNIGFFLGVIIAGLWYFGIRLLMVLSEADKIENKYIINSEFLWVLSCTIIGIILFFLGVYRILPSIVTVLTTICLTIVCLWGMLKISRIHISKILKQLNKW